MGLLIGTYAIPTCMGLFLQVTIRSSIGLVLVDFIILDMSVSVASGSHSYSADGMRI